ncbi:component of oligomeric golgi complex 2-like [Planoprotostelium fungivorum]|uniref:Conserved oligomeric Golgi complex subunit 2 n=1 Tax=Planoprotostelium fungivorum TaxID=1890364 RepID=A0A2P6NSK0_9EUKA|nr:component of oligomeric golgi complex 2-like [Planoprotostelium fungivorum]
MVTEEGENIESPSDRDVAKRHIGGRTTLSQSWNKILSPSTSSLSKSGYTPLTFSPDALYASNFSVDSFIAEVRRRQPLESFLSDLGEYNEALSSDLIELINKDYLDFVDLSANLVGLDRSIQDIRAPLTSIHKEVQEVQNALSERIKAFEFKMDERRQVLEKKSILELCIEVSRSMRQIERLMRGTGEDNEEAFSVMLSTDTETSSNLIERVASEFNQLKYHATKGKHLPFVKKQEEQLQLIEGTIERGLERLLMESLHSKNEMVMSNSLRTYSAVSKHKEAEIIYKERIVRPFVQSIVTPSVLEGDHLQAMYDQLIQFLRGECEQILRVSRSIPGFHFYVNGIAVEFLTCITQRLINMFRPAFPDPFHKNYLISMSFIGQLDEFCSTADELALLRSTDAYGDFFKKWNLSVYYQLRMQDIVSRFESSLLETSQDVQPPSKEEFSMNATRVLWNCLCRPWSKEVYLKPLGYKFFRLVLQLVVRYKQWIDQQCQEQGKTIQYWSFLFHDIVSIQDKDLVDPTLGGLTNEMTKELQASLDSVASELEGAKKKLSELITGPTSQRAVENLRAVRGIPAIYRFTNRSAPTFPSAYVTTTVTPMREFYNESALSWSVEQRTEWLKQISTRVIEQHMDMTSQMLSELHQAETARKKMVKNTKVGQAGSTTDIAKIQIQLFLDVDAFGGHFKQLGIDVDTFPPYHKLRESVSQGKRLQDDLNSGSDTPNE